MGADEFDHDDFRQGTSGTSTGTGTGGAAATGFDDDLGGDDDEDPPFEPGAEELRDNGRSPFHPGCVEVYHDRQCTDHLGFIADSCDGSAQGWLWEFTLAPNQCAPDAVAVKEDCNALCKSFNYDAGTCEWEPGGCYDQSADFCQCWVYPGHGQSGPPWAVPRSELPETI